MNKVVIAGGGTGGHIYPAVSVAQSLGHISKDTEVIFIGSHDRIENKIIPSQGYTFHGLKIHIPTRKSGLIKAGLSQITAFMEAFKLLKQIKPFYVVGIGGYISVPTVLAAKMLRIPVILLEQNVIPGKANQLLALLADNVALTFDASKEYFKNSNKCHVTGNPIRSDFDTEKLSRRSEISISLGLAPDKFTVIVMGGSQGSKVINDSVLEDLPSMLDNGWQVIHLAGEKNYEDLKKKAEEINLPNRQDYHLYPYYEDMPSMLACVDLCISRSGATTIAEMLFYKIPMILIPYPHAGGHQRPNAVEVQKNDAGIIIEESDLEKNKILNAIDNLKSENKLETMKNNAAKMRTDNPARAIAEIILQKKP